MIVWPSHCGKSQQGSHASTGSAVTGSPPIATDQKHQRELILHFEQNGDFIINAD